MMHRCVSVLVLLLGVLAMGLAGIAQQPATEAPAGFDTPTLAQNPGSQSKNNGLAEPTGDTFALDQQVYERVHDVVGLQMVCRVPVSSTLCRQGIAQFRGRASTTILLRSIRACSRDIS